jgi:Undecaprenyl-phosphate galactose phosphotransferase WbaP
MKRQSISAHTKPRLTCLTLILGDILALTAVGTTSVLLRYLFNGQFPLSLYVDLWPVLALFPMGFAVFGLYPGVMLTPALELKKICQAISFVFILLAIALFVSKSSQTYSRSIFLTSWAGSLIACPLMRALVRRLFSKKSWWGYPAIIFGGGKTGELIVSNLKLRSRLGLKVAGIFDDNPALQGDTVSGVPVLGTIKDCKKLLPNSKRFVAIVAIPGANRDRLLSIMECNVSAFLRVIIIPDLFGLSTMWVTATDIGGILGLEIQHKLLDPRRQAIKRIMDVALIIAALPLILPVVGIIALAVAIASPGPVFFRHQRIGMGGRDITIWKFRTMVPHAEEILADHLHNNPQALQEWSAQHKLTRDPRIFPLGRWLRTTSLDELPQLWNVLKGDLSLVGPRPIVWEEVEQYKAGFDTYKRVKPGLTGLWQISGRSRTSYDRRVDLDIYYVRNWSVWFDIYILARTPLEVFSCQGAL